MDVTSPSFLSVLLYDGCSSPKRKITVACIYLACGPERLTILVYLEGGYTRQLLYLKKGMRLYCTLAQHLQVPETGAVVRPVHGHSGQIYPTPR